jgi:type II secretory pathway pseudopilin PulG
MKQNNKKMRSAGLTIIELLISIAVGSMVLMFLMQMIVMNVQVKNEYEYENFLTSQALQITDNIRRSLNDLQPHHMLLETVAGTSQTVTFSHQYDIIYDPILDALRQSDENAKQDYLIYDIDAQTLTYNGALLHSPNIKILPGSQLSIIYFDDVNYDPVTCTDYNVSPADQICGDGILVLTLVMAVQFDGGLGKTFTFTTKIIV